MSAYPPQGGAPPPYGYAQGQPPQYGQPQYGQPQYGQQQYGMGVQPMGTQPQSNVVVVQTHQQRGGGGTCPNCGTGNMQTQYTLLGLILLVLCFPLGIICCLMMTERKCTVCNAEATGY